MSRNRDRDFDEDVQDDGYDYAVRFRRKPGSERHKRNGERADRERERRENERRRVAFSRPFKCRECRSFIGAPVSGGRQRNHCPNCLFSLHVDLKTPGDRRSECGSLMEPVATFFRLKGEQVLVHRCKGCGIERHNRIAADDNPLLLMRLALVEPKSGVKPASADERAETA